MKKNKTKSDLLVELEAAQQRIAELEQIASTKTLKNFDSAAELVSLNAKLEQALQQANLLYSLSKSLSEIEKMDTAMEMAADIIAQTLGFDRLSIIIFDVAKQTIQNFYKGGTGQSQIVEVSYGELLEGLSGWVLQKHQPALSPKAAPDPRESPTVQQRRQETECGAIMVVPILFQNKVLGTITAINRPAQRDFEQTDLDLLTSISGQMAVFIQNNHLYQTMSAEVKERKRIQLELEINYFEQERLIKARTAELAEKNQALQTEINERQKTQARLQASEQTLMLFVEYTPAAIAMFDRDMKYIVASRRYLADYRLGDQPVVGRSHYDIFPEISQRWKDIHQSCLNGAIEKEEQEAFPRADGTVDWVHWEIHPWYDTSGAIGGIILLSEVITDRIEAKNASRERENKLNKLFEILPVGISILDGEGKLVYENAALEKILEIKHTDLAEGAYKNRTYLAADGSPLPAEKFPSALAAQSGQAVYNVETGLVKEDEAVVWMSVSAVPVDFQDWKMVIVTSDITERKQAEAQLYQSEERLRLALKAANQGLYDLNLQTGEAIVNAEYALMLGYDPAEFHETNSAWIERLHPDDQALTANIYREYIAGTLPEYRVEFRQKTKQGAWKWLLSLGKIVEYDANGQPLRMLGTHTDITERKQVEAALRQGEDNFSKAFNSSPAALLITRLADGKYIELNDAYCKVVGYTRDELIGNLTTDFNIFIHSSNRQAIIQKLLATGSVRDFEVSLRHRSGAIHHVLAAQEMITFNGEPCVLSIFLDITERKQAEAALKNSNQRFEALLSQAPFNGVIYQLICDDHDNIIDWEISDINELGAASIGLTVASAIGKSAVALFGKNVMTPYFEIAQQVRASGKPQTFETYFESNKQYYLSSVFMVGSDHYANMGINITARKEAELALQVAENKYRVLAENSPDVIYIIDLTSYKTIYLNRDTLLGYTLEELEASGSILTKVHPEDLPAVQAHWQNILQGLPASAVEYRLRLKNGNYEWLNSRERGIIRDAAGKPTQLLVTLSVITERKQIEEELRRSNAELEQFAYVASHDLQEPLRAVAGMVQLLAQRYQGKLDERADEYIGHAVEAATRMQNLINALLNYSRVGRADRTLEKTNMEQVLNTALANLEAPIHESQAEITHEPLPTLLADTGQMIQVLQNLLGNALKFRGERPLHIHVGVEKLEGAWRFFVSDNGIGIDPQYFNRIFLVFQRLHTRREYPGTGIGLSLCKKIIERHGGQIWVESQPGQGTIFYFTIPEKKHEA